MKRFKAFLLAIPLLCGTAWATEFPAIDFGGGLNVRQPANQIADNESPDMSNFVSDITGSASKRNGSKRWISQAISSWPVTSLFRAYSSTNANYVQTLIATNKDSVYITSTNVNPFWVRIASQLAPGQHWNFLQMQNNVIMSGDALIDPIKKFNVLTGSFTNLFANDGSSFTATPTCKFGLTTRNYLIEANCADLQAGTTYYPSRMYYSLLLQPSSFTALRFIDIRTDDGEGISGVSELNKMVHFWKETSVSQLDFNILNLTALGGDQVLKTILYGIGLFAPRTLASTGDFYIFGAKDGIRLWDGGNTTRLNIEQQSRQLSEKIQPIINKAIKAGTWRNAVAKFYPKKQWYILSFEDPDIPPHGQNNTVMVYDFVTNDWYRFKNWLGESFVTLDGIGDRGQIMYGDSKDGYVYLVDDDVLQNDARKEIVLDTMDSTAPWARGNQDTINVVEGTGAVRMWINPVVTNSSVTLVRTINAGDFYDKSVITKNDKLAFKVYVTSTGNVSRLRVDLEMKDVDGDFDTNFTSVTISSSALTNSNTSWTTVEVALSSFPLQSTWVDLSSETLPFANALTFYGVRFVVQGIEASSVTIDDLRIVGGGESPLNAYRYTKQFDFQTVAIKDFRQINLNLELPSDSSFVIDAITDFGAKSNKIRFAGPFRKEIFVGGFGSTSTIHKLDARDFNVLDSTGSSSSSAFEYDYLVADDRYLYAFDRNHYSLLKLDRSSMSLVLASVGSLGPGTTNFSITQQMAIDDDNIYIADTLNERIKIHKKSNLSYVGSFGTLGLGATSFHLPTGIAVDNNFIWVADDSNYSIKKFSKSSTTLISQIGLNENTVGETTLAVDEAFLYDAYNSFSDENSFGQEVILEKRSKEDMSLVNRVFLRPQNSVALSTYALNGDIGITDNYIYVSFNNNDTAPKDATWYLQKRLKSDFSIVKELSSTKTMASVAGNGIAYKPKQKVQTEDLRVRGKYLQLKYSESDLDNPVKLINQSLVIISEGLQETK